jgi:hypothetical protein
MNNNWGPVATWAGVVFTIAVNVATLAYTYGVLQGRVNTVEAAVTRHEVSLKAMEQLPTRMQFAEDSLKRIEGNVSAMSGLMADVAVIKSQLTQLNENIKLLAQQRR